MTQFTKSANSFKKNLMMQTAFCGARDAVPLSMKAPTQVYKIEMPGHGVMDVKRIERDGKVFLEIESDKEVVLDESEKAMLSAFIEQQSRLT